MVFFGFELESSVGSRVTDITLEGQELVLQLSFLDQLVQMVPQIPIILRSVSLVSMVLAIKAVVRPCKVSSHLIRPFEK